MNRRQRQVRRRNEALAAGYLAALGEAATGRDQQRAAEIRQGTALPVDRTKIRSRSVMPSIPDLYRDLPFTCKGCGQPQVWTARQQKWWYEQAGGEIETTAILCRPCRARERARKANVRAPHLTGLARKKPNPSPDL